MGEPFMRKYYSLLLILFVFLTLAACDVDPYKGKRPIDYPKSTWNCNNNILKFSILDKGKDYVGLFKTKDNLVPVRFVWSKLNADVHIYSFSGAKELMFKGTNTFGETSFTMEIKDTNGYFEESSILLLCVRE